MPCPQMLSPAISQTSNDVMKIYDIVYDIVYDVVYDIAFSTAVKWPLCSKGGSFHIF